jgi:hypothetical protein
LKKKNQKNQEEARLKEQKRKEREEMKKKREDERKRKVEERAKKAEQKARQKAQKEEEQARKAEERAQRMGSKGKQPTRAGTKRKERDTNNDHCTKSKTPRTDANSFNENECCVCFVTYEEDLLQESGKDWVCCACSRWLHEDCAEDCVMDSNGMERLCPFRLDI